MFLRSFHNPCSYSTPLPSTYIGYESMSNTSAPLKTDKIYGAWGSHLLLAEKVGHDTELVWWGSVGE